MNIYAVYIATLGNRPDLFPTSEYPNASQRQDMADLIQVIAVLVIIVGTLIAIQVALQLIFHPGVSRLRARKLEQANVNVLYQKHIRQNPQLASNPVSRWQQKRAIRKQYAAAKRAGPYPHGGYALSAGGLRARHR